MSKELLELAAGDIRAIASAVRSGRLIEPVSALAVGRLVGANSAEEVCGLLTGLYSSGCSPEGVARCLDVLAAGAEQRRRLEESVQIVTTGPEMVNVANRDTMVVVEEMFRRAERNVLISGYAVYEGRKVFRELAARTQERPNLQIRMFLDIRRKAGDTSLDSETVWRFIDHFRRADWPEGCPLPEIYYDPRSLASDPQKRAVLHAKCVVVDDRELFVSSANFTEAAQERNIELGLLLQSSELASQVSNFFDSLVESGHCQRAN